MSGEKLIFVEKQLNRWKRPEPPKPGTAIVFVGDGRPSFVVHEGEKGLTQGEIIFGKYKTFYEVDMGDRSLEFHERLPCADVLEFNAEIRLTYAVKDPVIIIRRATTDASQFLKDLAIDVMRRVSRRYTHEQCGEAENAIAARIEDEIRDNGFKLTRSAFVKISLDDEIQTRLTTRKLRDYDFEDQKTQISRNTELKDLQQTGRLNLKGKRAEVFAPLIKSGDWATILAMLDPNDPEDEALKAMVEATLSQQKREAERKQQMLEIAIEKGAIEGWQLEGVAKALFQEVSGLSEQSIAYLKGQSEPQDNKDSLKIEETKSSFPDEISRDSDD